MSDCPTTAANLLLQIERQRVWLYEIAPRVGLHPAHLGAALRERRPMSPELASRIQTALDELAQERRAR